jgi:hypothetical protein
MENNIEKKELEQNAKKEWVSPEMQELNLNGGLFKMQSGPEGLGYLKS